jgi:hypothetical protein
MAWPAVGESEAIPSAPKRAWPAVGESEPIIDQSLLAVKELPEEKVTTSAIKDFQKVAGGIYQMGKSLGYVFVPGEENTLLKVGKYLEEAHEKGELGQDAWDFTKEAIMQPLMNIGQDLKPIVEEGIMQGTPEAAESIARRPFSFALDVLSLMGAGKVATGLAKGGASFATGKSIADIGRRVAQAEEIGAAKTASQLADELGDAFSVLDDKIKIAADEAKATLPSDVAKGFTPNEVNGMLDSAIGKVGRPISDASKTAIDALETYKERITKSYGTAKIPAPELKQIIQDLDDDIDWNTPKSAKANNAIKGLRKNIDTELKTRFPEYEDKMKPLAQLMETRENASKLLKVVRRKGEWEISDNAVSRMDRLYKGGYPKQKSLDVLGSFSKESGLDITGQMDLSTFRTGFEKSEQQATRTVLTGTLVGGWMGGLPGAAKGAAVGKALDKWGGKALGAGIDVSPTAFRAIGSAADAVPKALVAAPIVNEVISPEEEK